MLEQYFGAAPRVRQEVDYRSKLYFGQDATTVLELESLGRSSMAFRFEVWGEAHDGEPSGRVERRLAASGRFVTVHVPEGGEASAPWPDAIRAAVEVASPGDVLPLL